MNLSKSKYCNGIQCKKMLWLFQNKPEEAKDIDNEAVLDNGNLVHDLARNLFGKYELINYNENLSLMIEATKKALEKKKNIICEASFSYQNCFCSVDILIKNNDTYEVYEVKGSTKLKDVFKLDLAYQVYVLTKLGFQVSKCYVVTLNDKYVRHGELDLSKLFQLNDLTKDIYNMQDEVEKNINDIKKYLEQEKEPSDDIDNKCFKPYECPFFSYCTKKLPENNVFDLRRIHKNKKITLYKNDNIIFKDLLNTDIDDMYKQQIRYTLDNLDDYIDVYRIEEFLNTLSYPLYFLDFETFQSPIPPYDGISPYDQIPFQYSLHYIINDELKHKEFLSEAGIDPRRSLAERLVKDIPMNVCVLAYNMSFEKTVIKKLSKMYPDLEEHLMNIHDNIKDLMIPFKERYYYNRDMQGSYSIKYVLPALFPNDESLNYHNLDLIHNGSEAMNSFATLQEQSKEDQKYIRERLLRYCELDTYAMVKIYNKLLEIVKKIK